MPKERIPIPQTIADRVMAANRHTCCICHIQGKHVQIHHIDGNPSNNNPENLFVACLDCHSLASSDQGFGRRYTPGELRIYKKEWEDRCKVERTKANVIANFFVFFDKKPESIDPRFFREFITNVSSGTTPQEIYLSVEASTNILLNSTGNKPLAEEFKWSVLKDEDDKKQK